ncbi:MAG: hypothetical protein ACLP50_07715 [Solirubrobacteraceae bacterium]
MTPLSAHDSHRDRLGGKAARTIRSACCTLRTPVPAVHAWPLIPAVVGLFLAFFMGANRSHMTVAAATFHGDITKLPLFAYLAVAVWLSATS